MSNKKRKAQPPKPIGVPLKPRSHQPSKKELEEEIDMPAMSEKELRETFMRPFEFVEKH